MDKLGTALIGCGLVGDAHALALSSLQDSRFVAVYDKSQARAEALAARYGARAYTDLAKMLSSPAVQMASICTPHFAHVDLMVACAQAGVHTLVEKPLAVDLQGCDRAVAAAEEAGVKLGVVSQRRFYEPVQRVKQAIVAGKIEKPVLGTVVLMGWRDEAYYQMDAWRGKWRAAGGGVLLTQTSHHLDLLQWLMGPIDELYGDWANFNHPTVEVEDTAVAILRFKSGALGTILVSNAQKPGFYGKIHVHGQNGASVGVQTEGGAQFITGVSKAAAPPVNDIWTIPGEEHLLARWQAEDRTRCETVNVITHYLALQIQDFLDAIIQDREPAVSGREGRKSVELFTAIYRAHRDGRPVRFPLDAVRGAKQFDGRLA